MLFAYIFIILNVIKYCIILFSGITEFKLTKLGGNCSDIGKLLLGNEKECRGVAGLVGAVEFEIITGSGIASFPSGCFMHTNKTVFWNPHETGRKNDLAQAICSTHGSFIFFSIFLIFPHKITLTALIRSPFFHNTSIQITRILVFK